MLDPETHCSNHGEALNRLDHLEEGMREMERKAEKRSSEMWEQIRAKASVKVIMAIAVPVLVLWASSQFAVYLKITDVAQGMAKTQGSIQEHLRKHQ